MSKETIAAAKARHERDMHIEEFEVCQNPECRAATTEINRELAIERMQIALRLKEIEGSRVYLQ